MPLKCQISNNYLEIHSKMKEFNDKIGQFFSFEGFPFLGTRKSLVICLNMKGKICLNISACSKTGRNELSSEFRVSTNET